VDAIANKVTLDFYLRLYWQDNRFNMPAFWKRMSPRVRRDGFELTNILDSELGIKIWTPDIRFHDAAELEYLAYVSFRIASTFILCQNTD
jgi:hypothetical protein